MKELDLYTLDTKEMDLSIGLEELDIDMEEIKKQTKTKLHMQGKKTLRMRFRSASTFVKAAAIVGILAVSTTSAVATSKLFFYVPNQGISAGKEMRVMEVPVSGYSKEGFYLRITSLSYDGETLKLAAESNWQDEPEDDRKKEQPNGEFMHKRGIRLMKGEELILNEDTKESYGVITQVEKRVKVDSLEELSLVLNALKYNQKEGKYHYYDEVIKIPLKDLVLSKAKEAKSVADLGTEVVDEGIGLVGISSLRDGVRSIDFQASKLPEKITMNGVREYNVTTADGKKKEILNEATFAGIRTYLLFGAGQQERGTVDVSSISVNKELQERQLEFLLPKVGETVEINQVVEWEGVKVRIESLTLHDKEEYSEGEWYYHVQLELRILEVEDTTYKIQESTFVEGGIEYGKNTNGSYGYMGGKTSFGCSIPEKDFNPNGKIKVTMKSINQLDKIGNWKIPF